MNQVLSNPQPTSGVGLEEATAALRATLRGELLQLGDDGYEGARLIWNGMFDKKPALIVQCGGTADVIEAVNFARETGMPTAVRCGGHNSGGSGSCDGGILIDLSGMNAVHVDPGTRRARVQGGATWGDFDREAQVHGLATPGGVVSATGVGGLTPAGGLGWLSGKYGLSLDNLVSLVLAVKNLLTTPQVDDIRNDTKTGCGERAETEGRSAAKSSDQSAFFLDLSRRLRRFRRSQPRPPWWDSYLRNGFR